MVNVNNLRIYKLAREIGKDVYRITKNFPAEERYGLTSQMRRAAISIGANISEGAGRRTKTDFHRFLFIARGSIKETTHYMGVSRENTLITQETFIDLSDKLDKLGRMITLFVRNSPRHPDNRRSDQRTN